MTNIYIIFFVFLAFYFQMAITEKSAVLMYGHKMEPRIIRTRLSQKDFAGIVSKIPLANYAVINLVEEELNDLNCLNYTEEYCLKRFPKSELLNFYYRVTDPILALASFFKKYQIIEVENDGQLTAPLRCENDYGNALNTVSNKGKIPEKELLKYRANVLQKIEEGLRNCKKFPLYFFLFTRKINMANGEITGAGQNPDGENIDAYKTFLVKRVSTTISKHRILIDIASEDTPLYQSSNRPPFELTISRKKLGTNRYLYEITINNEKYSLLHTKDWPIGLPTILSGYIFRAGKNILRIDKIHLTIYDDLDEIPLKIPLFESFGDCKYVTPGIISGLFISAILLGILCWGIIMIIDIKACDRFDSENRKPLGSFSD